MQRDIANVKDMRTGKQEEVGLNVKDIIDAIQEEQIR
jgi:hypothetical protein